MNEQNVHAIGVDIGGTHTKIALVDNRGKISDLVRIETAVNPQNPKAFIERICETAKRIQSSFKGNIVGVGVSCLGMQNENGSGPRYSVNVPGLNDYNIRDCLQSQLGLPVKVTNDLMSHTLAEYYYGVGRGCTRFLCVAIGTGIGAAAINNGEPIELWGGTSGDSGRIPLDPKSEFVCGGNIHGSAEALCGVAGIEEYARRLYRKEGITAKDVITACRTGNDPIAEEIIKIVGQHTGHLIAILAMIFGPDRVALAGGTANAGQVLLDSCCDRFDEIAGDYFRMLARTDPPVLSEIEIVFGKMRGEAGVVGGALGILK